MVRRMDYVDQKERTGIPDKQDHQHLLQNLEYQLGDRVGALTFQKDETEAQREEVAWNNREMPHVQTQIPGPRVPRASL